MYFIHKTSRNLHHKLLTWLRKKIATIQKAKITLKFT